MLKLGTPMPDFSLPDTVSGKTVTSADTRGRKATLVMFICRHCPYVQHVKSELKKLGDDYRDRDVGIVAISSNDPAAYPLDAPASLGQFAMEEGLAFPLLFDETQQTAKAYTAACTPDLFLFDAAGLLVYRGQVDDSRPGNEKPLTGKDIRAAIDAVLSGTPVSSDQHPSSGCGIKWKPGNEPVPV